MNVPMTLMALRSQHKHYCRPVGEIVADARTGKLRGIEPLESGIGFRVVYEQAALASLRKQD